MNKRPEKPKRNHFNLWLAAFGVAAVVGVVAAVVGESQSVKFRVETARSVGMEFEFFYGIAGAVALLLAGPILYASRWFYQQEPAQVAVVGVSPSGAAPDLPFVRMNPAVYLTFFYGAALAGAVCIGWGLTERAVQELIVPGIMLTAVASITFYVFLFKAWKAVQDGHARTSAGRAIGYMLVPFYNFYWIFQVIPGWAQDYNALAHRYGASLPPQNDGLAKAFVIAVFVPIFGTLAWFVLAPKLVKAMCDGVNRLAPLQRQQ